MMVAFVPISAIIELWRAVMMKTRHLYSLM